jgi:hypothetical protein
MPTERRYPRPSEVLRQQKLAHTTPALIRKRASQRTLVFFAGVFLFCFVTLKSIIPLFALFLFSLVCTFFFFQTQVFLLTRKQTSTRAVEGVLFVPFMASLGQMRQWGLQALADSLRRSLFELAKLHAVRPDFFLILEESWSWTHEASLAWAESASAQQNAAQLLQTIGESLLKEASVKHLNQWQTQLDRLEIHHMILMQLLHESLRLEKECALLNAFPQSDITSLLNDRQAREKSLKEALMRASSLLEASSLRT